MNKLEVIIKALDDKLAEDIVVIDMQLASPIFDTFVICSASNERLMNALRDSVEDSCHENGYEVKKIEGLRNSKWLLMDYGDIVVLVRPTLDKATNKCVSIYLMLTNETVIILRNYGLICHELTYQNI